MNGTPDTLKILCRKCTQHKPPRSMKKGWTKSTLRGICKQCNSDYCKDYHKKHGRNEGANGKEYPDTRIPNG